MHPVTNIKCVLFPSHKQTIITYKPTSPNTQTQNKNVVMTIQKGAKEDMTTPDFKKKITLTYNDSFHKLPK